jgi:predicted DNA-binding ArsR family transcriptional regulator
MRVVANQRFEKPHRSLRVEENNGRRKWRQRTPENGRRTYRSYMVAIRDVHIQGACSMNDVHDLEREEYKSKRR